MVGNNSVLRNVISVSDLNTSMSGIECVPISGRSKFILKKVELSFSIQLSVQTCTHSWA